MTQVYFVRHAQPEYDWDDERTRPLTNEGKSDSEMVVNFFMGKHIDVFYCSPYQRSISTIQKTADMFKMKIITDERLREREKGSDGNNFGMFRRRWADKNFHEDGGESLNAVQKRNIEALNEILDKNEDKTIVIGTHGTALSSILNYYNSDFDCDDFLRIIDWMPYIIELDFDKRNFVSYYEHLYLQKEFKGSKRADKK